MLATEEPDTYVVETHGDMELFNGRSYNNQYISVVKLRDEKVIFVREYYDLTVMLEAYGPDP